MEKSWEKVLGRGSRQSFPGPERATAVSQPRGGYHRGRKRTIMKGSGETKGKGNKFGKTENGPLFLLREVRGDKNLELRS